MANLIQKALLVLLALFAASCSQHKTVRFGICADVRMTLEAAKLRSGKQKVIAYFSGHQHIDYSTSINGINYIQINSMSYYWMGGDYLQVRYSDEIDEQYPYIKYTAPCKDPIYAIVTIDTRGIIQA